MCKMDNYLAMAYMDRVQLNTSHKILNVVTSTLNYQIRVRYLIQRITENRLRYARGPVCTTHPYINILLFLLSYLGKLTVFNAPKFFSLYQSTTLLFFYFLFQKFLVFGLKNFECTWCCYPIQPLTKTHWQIRLLSFDEAGFAASFTKQEHQNYC